MNVQKVKKFIILILFINLNLAFSQENFVRKWEQIDLKETRNPWANGDEELDLNEIIMLDIQFLESNKNYGWISGFKSIVLRTTDGGENWLPSFVDEDRLIQVESVWFLNERVGYASGPFERVGQNGGRIYKTEDGGESWRQLNLGNHLNPLETESIGIWGLYFIDENNGWVMGGNCTNVNTKLYKEKNILFFKTTDGGITWELKSAFSEVSPNSKLSDLVMNQDGNGYAISSGILWETNDFGDTWNKKGETKKIIMSGDTLTTNGFDWHEDISIFNNSIVVPVTNGCSGSQDNGKGGIRVSKDLGETWINYNTEHPMYGSYMHSDTRAFAVGEGNSMYETRDGGQNWFLNNFCLNDVFLDDLYYVSEEEIWIVGDGVYKSYFGEIENLDLKTDTVTICRGEEYEFEVSGNYQKYSWEGFDNNTNKLTVIAGDEQIYSVSYYDSNCPDTMFTKDFVLDSYPVPEVNVEIVPNRVICEGETYQVSIQSDVPFEFRNTETGELFTSNTFFEISDPTQLTLNYGSETGCTYLEPYNFRFNPLPEPEINLLTEFSVCVGDSVILQLNNNFSDIKWKTADGTLIQDGGTVYDAKETNEIYVVATNQFGCQDSTGLQFVEIREEENQLNFSAQYGGEFLKIPDVEDGQTICGYILLENFSSEQFVLTNPVLLQNQEFSIPTNQLPFVLEPFGADSLMICFESEQEGLRQDSLVIGDICFDHYIPINGNVRFNDFESDSRCNLDIIFENFNSTNFYTIYFGTPYPNPAVDFTFSEFVEFDPRGLETQVRGELYNQLGNKILDATVTVIDEANEGGEILRKGEIFFDTSELNNGIYQIALIGPNRTENFTLAIRK
jgi:photosystem II stability/assembly factor-like uncharacterized protein